MSKLTEAIRELNRLAKQEGFNIFQPGMAKEIIIADALGHIALPSKHGPDAKTRDGLLCEYLSMLEGNPAQIDRMYASPSKKLERSLDRIRRNDLVFVAVFCRNDHLHLLRVYEVDKTETVNSARDQLSRYKIPIGHVHFTEEFASTYGKIVYTA